MRDFRDAKAMAQTLRDALKAKSVSLTRSESLELIAKSFGLPDWNYLAARIAASQTAPDSSVAGIVASMPGAAGIPILPMRDLVRFSADGRAGLRRARQDQTRHRARRRDRRPPSGDHATPRGRRRSRARCALFSGRHRQRDFTARRCWTAHSSCSSPAMNAAWLSGLSSRNSWRPRPRRSNRAAATPRKRWCCFARCSRPTRNRAKVDFSVLPQGPQAGMRLPSMDEPGALADAIAPLLPVAIEQKQQLLETTDVVVRLAAILELMKASQHAA